MGLASGSMIGLATLTLGWLGYSATQQPTAPQAPSLEKRVTASLSDATMDEVLQWLRKTGVNFVIDKGDASAHSKLNINVVDKPLKDVMDAIASAVGGKWQKHGDVYSLHTHGDALAPLPFGDFDMGLVPEIKERLGDLKFEISPEMRERLEAMIPDIEEQLQELEKSFGPELRGLAPKIRGMMPGPDGMMRFRMPSSQQREELLNSVTPKQKELMKSRGHLVTEDLTPRQREILESLGRMTGRLSLQQDGREFTFQGPMGERGGMAAPAPPRARGLAPRAPMPPEIAEPAMPRMDAVPMPDGPHWDGLISSLTAEQNDLLKTQGYLYADQLTPDQRGLLALPHDASYTITIVKGDKSITIKTRKQ